MPTYVEIVASVPKVSGVFDYHLPEHLEEQVKIGHLVLVPFGQQTVQGVVLRVISNPSVSETRPVLELVDPAAVLTESQIELAQSLSAQALAPLSTCIELMLPPGLAQHADRLYTLHFLPAVSGESEANLSQTQKNLLKLLGKRGALRGSQIDHALPRSDWRPGMQLLLKRGWVTAQSVLPAPRIRPKHVRTAQLACSPERALEALPGLARTGSQALARRQAILNYLLKETSAVDVTWLYASSGGNLADLYALEELGLIMLGETEVWRDPLEQYEFLPSHPPALTADQEKIWGSILEEFKPTPVRNPSYPYLLHGVTGSGKTEIYLRAVDQTLQSGKQAIILVPEIALTPQTLRRFAGRFPGRTGLIHSRLSLGERYDTWRRARNGDLSLVIGPRSALFTPFPDLGLIVVDECHDETYYQSDSLPYYHAAQAAIDYAGLVGAVCILGSATPDITTIFQARQGRMHYLQMPNRILAHRQAIESHMTHFRSSYSNYQPLEGEAETIELPKVNLVDMRQELQAGNRSIFSRPLQSALAQVLEHGQQAILFLNRRGMATYIFCRECGSALKCPRCDIPLTYHLGQEGDFLRCHYCGYRRKLPQTCPTCSSHQIRHYGTGTERVEAELLKLFPQAQPLRWDYETTRHKGAHEMILAHFAAQRANVLIGTQMIAKGLDLPLVTLVGVILADVGLNLPDYRAAERTFQILTQVAGRAGRSLLGGQVILQSFQPEHYVLQAASGHSYDQFYERELAHRRRLGLPPFSRMVRLEFRHTNAQKAEQVAAELTSEIRAWMADSHDHNTEIIGPAPCFFQRLGGVYRCQIILRGPDPTRLVKDRRLPEWKIEVNPPNLL